ncbi:type IV toxin-antitoxin system AbiEi family antitoxin domain-containing protein [Rossellomorea marisflavi]|uniref:DNA-binding protein n=1 Tax=Rossellomorea marisflavi TaxID=189381 RepID=UPI003D2B4256
MQELQAFIQNEVLNTSQTVEILGCSRQNLSYLVQKGDLVPIKEFARDRLFWKEDILKKKASMKSKA